MRPTLTPDSSQKMTRQDEVAYFTSVQNPQLDTPTKTVTRDEARRLKKANTHYFADGGRAIVEIPPFLVPEIREGNDVDGRRRVERFEWKVVGQTAKPGVRHRPTSIGPGNPRYALV